MTDFFNIPETAIAAYEAWSHLRVFIWDIDKTHFLPYLPPIRMTLDYPHCLALRDTELHDKCIFFEQTYIFEEIGKHPEGVIKVCHANLLEWCIPIYLNHQVVSILYAGHRSAIADTPVDFHDPQPLSTNLPWAGSLQTPKRVEKSEAILLMEGLRQLAARLQLWLLEAQTITGKPSPLPRKNDLITRRNLILNFIYEKHTEQISLADLAEYLHLSQSRTSHVVKEACGQTFSTLLMETRIRSATSLLRHSQLPVSDIAYRCGILDPSRFFKLFKQETGLTPIAYRQQHWQLDRG